MVVTGTGVAGFEMKARTKFIIGWLMMAAVILAILVPLTAPTFFRLAERGRRTTASIVKLDCGNHNSASYVFAVNSESYLSGDSMITDCRSLHIGDRIAIYYDADDPHLTSATEPISGLVNDFIFIGLSCLLFPPTIIGIVRRRTRKASC